MRYSILALLLLLTGCDQISNAVASLKSEEKPIEKNETYLVPCYLEDIEMVGGKPQVNVRNEHGYKYITGLGSNQFHNMTHCLPCTQAKSADEKFTCQGEGK